MASGGNEKIKDFVVRYVPIIPKKYRKKELGWEELRSLAVENWERFRK